MKILSLVPLRFAKILAPFLILFLILIPTGLLAYNHVYNTHSPENIVEPEFAHHHFRMQFFDGDSRVDFSQDKFQEDYVKDACVGLAETPIHFHDGQDQIVHIHWRDITGGQVLKYYGLNLIGGVDDVLAYKKSSNLLKPDKINIFADVLNPSVEKLHIYTGDKNNYEKRELKEFLKQDLETFFGQESSYSGVTQVFAHNDESDGHHDGDNAAGEKEYSQDELEQLNDLIGNIVIYAQEDEPSEERIKEAFNNLVELEPSTCGG